MSCYQLAFIICIYTHQCFQEFGDVRYLIDNTTICFSIAICLVPSGDVEHLPIPVNMTVATGNVAALFTHTIYTAKSLVIGRLKKL